MRRLVALSSTISSRLPRSSACSPCSDGRALPVRRWPGSDGEVEGGALARHTSLSTHIVPPIISPSRLLMASPSPVPP